MVMMMKFRQKQYTVTHYEVELSPAIEGPNSIVRPD